MLADVAAKLAVVNRCARYVADYCGDDWVGSELVEDILRAFVVPFAAHDDYRDEWRPRE